MIQSRKITLRYTGEVLMKWKGNKISKVVKVHLKFFCTGTLLNCGTACPDMAEEAYRFMLIKQTNTSTFSMVKRYEGYNADSS